MPSRPQLVSIVTAVLLVFAVASSGLAQSIAPPPASLSALVDQTVGLFPVVAGEVLEVRDGTLTLSAGRASGARPGVLVEIYREGREIRHPRTGEILGRAEETVGHARLSRVFDAYSLATPAGDAGIQPGDRVRTDAGKVKLVLLALRSPAVKQSLVEAAVTEVYEGLNRTGRFQISFGDQIAVWLTREGIAPEEFLAGRGVREAANRFGADTVLAIHFTALERKPYMDARVFAGGHAEAALTTAFFVPPSIKPAPPGRFSTADRARPEEPPRRRSLLERLLGLDVDRGAYSTAERSMTLHEVARVPFAVAGMDVAVAAADGIPRIAMTDGERVYMYRLNDRTLEAEWSFHSRSLGRIISLQLAQLTDDGTLAAVVNRFHVKTGMSSFIVANRGGTPVALVDNVNAVLLAVDDKGAGVKQTLWAQSFREESFFDKGSVDRMVLKNGSLVRDGRVSVPGIFRATGATFTNVTGKDRRGLAYIDEQQRLRISVDGVELWQSSTAVGGGGVRIEVERWIERGGRSYFYRMEPIPLSVDLDGDGIEELVVPQNQTPGLLAVIYAGPAGLRMQQVNSGFDGVIAAMGAVPGGEGGAPTLIAGVVRGSGLIGTLARVGETQIIVTVPED